MKIKNVATIFFFLLFSTPAISQSQTELIKSIGIGLSKAETTVSEVLSDPILMPLHSLIPFRETIKQHAKAEKIKLNTDNEPGTKITVKGKIVNKAGDALADKLVYVYQTSSAGWYSDTAPHILKNEGDRRHARIFGYFKTDPQGNFEFATVKPTGYPNSSLPAHIHIEIALSSNQNFISELLFDDDARLVGDIRIRSIAEKFIISTNSGTKDAPVYIYTIQVSN